MPDRLIRLPNYCEDQVLTPLLLILLVKLLHTTGQLPFPCGRRSHSFFNQVILDRPRSSSPPDVSRPMRPSFQKSIDKPRAIDSLTDLLSRRQFDLIAVSNLRSRYRGDRGLTTGGFSDLLDHHTRPFSSLEPSEIRSLVKLLLRYFDWNDAVLERDLADVLR
jgi:hypothetical protein